LGVESGGVRPLIFVLLFVATALLAMIAAKDGKAS